MHYGCHGGTKGESEAGRAEALIASGALAALLASGAKLTDQALLPISPWCSWRCRGAAESGTEATIRRRTLRPSSR